MGAEVVSLDKLSDDNGFVKYQATLHFDDVVDLRLGKVVLSWEYEE